MKKSLLILTFCILIFGCQDTEASNQSQAKYTYSINGWENLGSQTLVLIDASNPSKLDQNINFTISVINKEGKRFNKDTTVHFNKSDKQIDFQLLVETEGEIDKVEITAKD